MNVTTFTYLLEHPEDLSVEQTAQLGQVLEQFPFFQSAWALCIKGLKNQESFRYNKALQRTAAHTQDRSVLFDFITSPVFLQNAISDQIRQQQQDLSDMEVHEVENVSEQLEKEELHKANSVLASDFFQRKEEEKKLKEKKDIKTLQLGKTLDFDKKETHSFTEWLKLTAFAPIKREQNQAVVKITKVEQKFDEDRLRKNALIDQFINNNPKIQVKPLEGIRARDVQQDFKMSPESLMTETLARVYVEQKNYKKALQAYRILSLKYPEKNGFFADQIRAIKRLDA